MIKKTKKKDESVKLSSLSMEELHVYYNVTHSLILYTEKSILMNRGSYDSGVVIANKELKNNQDFIFYNKILEAIQKEIYKRLKILIYE